MGTGAQITRTGFIRGPSYASPRLIVVALLAAVVINGACITWLCSTVQMRSSGTYLESQLELWLHESRRHPDSPLAWATLGGIYESLGEAASADQAYDTALALDSGNVPALLHRAGRDQVAGDYDLARVHIFSAIEHAPPWAEYRSWYRLGMLEEAAGRPGEALSAYGAAVTLCATCWRSHYRMALIYEQQGDTNRALVAIGEALRWAQSDPEVLETLERLSSLSGEHNP